jgi:hypothetical protein
MENRNSGVNTVLLVIILVLIVGFGVWWFTNRRTPMVEENTAPGINLDVNLPTGNNNSDIDGGDDAGNPPSGGSGETQ